jgi:alkanesulfonate monooxygenase SsuD/methylene tetrahydromethanopterin reductase-like flavin-dependent oxidoreductase (luciferase family)
VKLAFGIPATGDRQRAARIGLEVERLGFSTIWSNDLPHASGLATAEYIAGATSAIRIAVGVLPCDRNLPPQVAMEIRKLALPLDRLVVGIGAGSSKNPIQAVRDSVDQLRDDFGPTLTIGVGAMGPKMCRLAGEVADLVLLNWMTPERVAWARRRIQAGSTRAGRGQPPEVAGYVRTAMGKGAIERIRSEAQRYYAMPAYRRHFDAMGEQLRSVGINADDEDLPSRLTEYGEVLDEVVIRALPESDSLESTLAVAKAIAPAR